MKKTREILLFKLGKTSVKEIMSLFTQRTVDFPWDQWPLTESYRPPLESIWARGGTQASCSTGRFGLEVPEPCITAPIFITRINTSESCVAIFLKKKKNLATPGQCGSVGFSVILQSKGHRFDSQSGHMPGLQAWSLVGAYVRHNRLMFLSHISVSFPLFLPTFPSK